MKNNTQNDAVSDKNILLAGVFGPFAQDDEYGSRKVNPMELYHNQVTRVQGPFSLRMFHRTFGLLMIEANIEAPCTILEFADLDGFIEEVKHGGYDIIGISSILPNILKVEKMCREIRAHSPGTEIVIGGHIAAYEHLGDEIDTDHICRGDGITWFRQHLGQDVSAPIKHPTVISGFGTRIMGITTPGTNTAGTLIPSVGCPVGCNFCSTSALFGGKGNSCVFYESGDELFTILCGLEKSLKVQSFFILDENFLLYKGRTRRLLELMEAHDKSWSFYVFSSARVINSYTMDELVRLGVSWLWMGLEGEDSSYSKLKGIDTPSMIQELQANGIRVLGSTIIGLEEHSPENIDDVINYAVRHNTDFHQFMLYTPLPGTPLHREHREKGDLLSVEECPHSDVHGQERFNFVHTHINGGMEGEYLLRAFRKDFDINGPSLLRIAETTLKGWRTHKAHRDRRVRRRFRFSKRGLGTVHAASAWAMTRWFRKRNRTVTDKARYILKELYKEFGIITRIISPVLGILVLYKIKQEDKRLSAGWTYEPPVIYEKNERALALPAAHEAKKPLSVHQRQTPVYDVSHVSALCARQMNTIYEQFLAARERAGEQISELTRAVSAPGINGTEQLAQIQNSLRTKHQQAKEQLQEIRQRMTAAYSCAREEIENKYDNFSNKCQELLEQTLGTCHTGGRP